MTLAFPTQFCFHLDPVFSPMFFPLRLWKEIVIFLLGVGVDIGMGVVRKASTPDNMIKDRSQRPKSRRLDRWWSCIVGARGPSCCDTWGRMQLLFDLSIFSFLSCRKAALSSFLDQQTCLRVPASFSITRQEVRRRKRRKVVGVIWAWTSKLPVQMHLVCKREGWETVGVVSVPRWRRRTSRDWYGLSKSSHGWSWLA